MSVSIPEVGDDKSINVIILPRSMKNFSCQSSCDLRNKQLAGGQVIGNMNVIKRSRLQSNHEPRKVSMRTEKICKILSQINSTGLVIGNSKRQNQLSGFKIKKSDDVFAGANINPDKQSGKKTRLLHKNTPPFRFSGGWVEKESF